MITIPNSVYNYQKKLKDMKTLNTLLLLTLIIMPGCAKTNKVDNSHEKEQINENCLNWIKAAERGNVDDYFNYITDDFIFLGQGMKSISNRDSLRAFLDKFFTDYSFSLPTWTTQEIIIRDDIAIHRWSWIAYMKSKSDNTVVEFDRKYLDVYKKNEKGEWKGYLHSFNTNK
ncbi:MAG: hypothetical protein A2X03_13000 [Bacteroidetes bacterium GWA2_40_15]|nr:MAG: hypothetical protein A2X03_13000 [Bacteroidetes bacterium GWA2_40_15]